MYVNKRTNYIICKIYHSLETTRNSVLEEKKTTKLFCTIWLSAETIPGFVLLLEILACALLDFVLRKRHQWTHADMDHANHARS